MPHILENISLKPYNTFHVEARASYFSTFSSTEELEELVDEHYSSKTHETLPVLILGGGSNMLFVRDYAGLVLHNQISGIEVLSHENDHVFIQAGAGVVWHDFVLYCIQHGYGGIENLSLIPGTVGASPIQNIGAYGVEVKDVIEEVQVYDLERKEFNRFNNQECQFDYRSSIFKTTGKNKYVVIAVVYKLTKTPVLQLEYGAIRNELNAQGISSPSIKDVSDAIIRIRTSKLPNPADIGNAGSFFKNPVVTEEQLTTIKSAYEHVVYNKVDNGYKLAAGWLIEKAGWKGYRNGDAGVHAKQALVLVNYGNALGEEILAVAHKIQASVLNTFGVALEMEVNVIR